MVYQCSKCGEYKEESAYYPSDVIRGYHRCKECRRVALNAYRQTPLGRLQNQARVKRWREEHPDKARAGQARRRAKARERLREQMLIARITGQKPKATACPRCGHDLNERGVCRPCENQAMATWRKERVARGKGHCKVCGVTGGADLFYPSYPSLCRKHHNEGVRDRRRKSKEALDAIRAKRAS